MATEKTASKRRSVKANGGLLLVDITLTGVKPLLMNAISQETLWGIVTGTKPPKTAAKVSVEEQAEAKVHRLGDGRPHIPLQNLWGCLVKAGCFVRLDGKRQVSTKEATTLSGLIQLMDGHLPLYQPGRNEPATYVPDMRAGCNVKTNDMVAVVRPRFDAWELRLQVAVDQQWFTVEGTRMLFDIAGKRVGLGSLRPEKRGFMGTFVVTRWEEQHEACAA